MRITVTDGTTARSGEFSEGKKAGEIIAELGFDFTLPCGGAGRCGKCRVRLNGEEVPACRTELFSDAVIEIPAGEAAVLGAEERAGQACGVAIDIGTTTVAAALFSDGRPVKTLGRKNPQCAYGADVISRVGYKNPALLTRAITALVRELRRELGPEENTVITGNTAMLSLLCGLDVSGMGVWPFTPPSAFDTNFDGAWLPPCPAAFVGADALCSMLWTRSRGETALMLDLGTNGEIGLVCGDKYYFTSAAAGPAMEGAGIGRGMAAEPGAIFRADGGGFQVIGGGEPKGICGSGLADVMALMLDGGAMDAAGAIKSDYEIHRSGVFITQADVRAFQLCKAALAAGAGTLLKKCGLSAGDLDRVYLSGALGKNIDVKNAVRTGLLPDLPEEKFVPIGNGALMGAALLLDEDRRREIRSIAGGCTCFDLAADPDFAESFIREIDFPKRG